MIWRTPLAEYVNRSLTDIRHLKTHGEKRVRVVLEVFYAVHELLSNANSTLLPIRDRLTATRPGGKIAANDEELNQEKEGNEQSMDMMDVDGAAEKIQGHGDSRYRIRNADKAYADLTRTVYQAVLHYDVCFTSWHCHQMLAESIDQCCCT